MTIKERIKKIKDYFKEMQIVTMDGEQIIYVVVNFPQGWVIDEIIESKYDVAVNEGEYPTEFYFATNIDNGEERIFDAIEYNIERMKDAIERAQLLRTKIAELKDIFQNEDITLPELRSLKFTWDKTEHISIQDIMPNNGNTIIANDSISVSTSSNHQDTTTSAEVERQYTSEDNKKNKK